MGLCVGMCFCLSVCLCEQRNNKTHFTNKAQKIKTIPFWSYHQRVELYDMNPEVSRDTLL